jgi:DNA-binding GntR family transcriptional regulator
MSSEPGGAPPSLADQAYRSLEQKLVALELPPGSVLSEGQLIELTGYGRTPVREAMLRLAQQGLFRVMPRKGLAVTPVERASMLHILEARKPLERVIVYRASINARDTQRSELSAIAREMTVSHDSFGGFMVLIADLDELLDRCAGNAFATAAVAPLRSHCRRFWNYHRDRIQLSDAISVYSKMARLIARREFNGAQKASDAVIAVMERMAGSIGPVR